MTDKDIEKIVKLLKSALDKGQGIVTIKVIGGKIQAELK
jgi:hypothetical protein